jgi:hypothetical protein
MRSSALLLLVPLSGCILIAPNFDPVGNCPIHGDSACGTCLRANCQGEINNCCGTKECRETEYSIGSDDETFTTVSALDTCAAGNAASCSSALTSARKSPAGTAVNSCVQNKCRAECVPNAPVSKWTCDAPHGSDACSSCIYSTCAEPVTSCCGEGSGYSACPMQLQDEMTACTTGDAPGCSAMASNSSAGKEGVVRACVEKSCADKCFGNGRPHQSCSLQGGGAYCSCSNAKEASGDECSTTTVPKSHCVFTTSGCVCGHFACTAKGDSTFPSCECNLTNATEGTGAATKCNPTTVGAGGLDHDSPAYCCLTPGSSYEGTKCTCETLGSTCQLDAIRVYSCDKSSFFSALADVLTDTCSQ